MGPGVRSKARRRWGGVWRGDGSGQQPNRQTHESEDRQGYGRFNPPDQELDKIYNDKTKKRRITGKIDYAIDGNEETAWGIDAGPARRNLPRKAVFVAEKPISHPGGSTLIFLLNQRHGGWNSDDNMNHNLGRFRLSITTAADPVADPLPLAVREILTIPAGQRSAAQTQAVFAYWRTTVEEWKKTNEQIEALWKQHPEGSSQLILHERDEMRTTNLLNRGDFFETSEESGSRGAGLSASDAEERSGEPVRACAVDCRSQLADDGAVDRKPDLAKLFRNRDCGDE